MSSHSGRAASAEIVDMVSVLQDTGRKRVAVMVENRTATLLSIRQSLDVQASVGFDDIDALNHQHSHAEINFVLASLRKLLNTEFGSLRVHRYRQWFVVSHFCRESLVAGLLRVQYHARQLSRQQAFRPDKKKDGSEHLLSWPVTCAINWGVGSTVSEAECDRILRISRNPAG